MEREERGVLSSGIRESPFQDLDYAIRGSPFGAISVSLNIVHWYFVSCRILFAFALFHNLPKCTSATNTRELCYPTTHHAQSGWPCWLLYPSDWVLGRQSPCTRLLAVLTAFLVEGVTIQHFHVQKYSMHKFPIQNILLRSILCIIINPINTDNCL